MRARAESTRATRERILDSAHALMLERSYDVLTLADVAEAAGVTFQTVLRHFGSKDGLVAAVAQSRGQQEFARRDALSGDARDVARVLCDRYEATGDAMVHWEALEDRVEVVGRAIAGARAGHAAWLRDKFSGQLESLGPREARLTIAALQAVTDIGTWRLWRRRLGLPKADVRTNMERLIEGALAAAHDVEVKCRSGRAAAKKRRRDG
jgi:AcrR family transcriptional regulator